VGSKIKLNKELPELDDITKIVSDWAEVEEPRGKTSKEYAPGLS
jgi:hypothetical protein